MWVFFRWGGDLFRRANFLRHHLLCCGRHCHPRHVRDQGWQTFLPQACWSSFLTGDSGEAACCYARSRECSSSGWPCYWKASSSPACSVSGGRVVWGCDDASSASEPQSVHLIFFTLRTSYVIFFLFFLIVIFSFFKIVSNFFSFLLVIFFLC